jgi:hypothetical protein
MSNSEIHKNRVAMVKYAQENNPELRKLTGNIIIISNLDITEDFTATLRNGVVVRTRIRHFHNFVTGYSGHW